MRERGAAGHASSGSMPGVDGFRLDAIPYLIEREGTNNENLPETHAVIKELRARARRRLPRTGCCSPRPTSGPRTCAHYFGDGDECHMAYHFPLMPRIYMAIAQEDRFPITDILRQTPDIPDELPVGALPAQPRRADARDGHRPTSATTCTDATPHDPRARINLGIRRRLAPLMDNDRAQDRADELRCCCRCPGTPIIYYGDEIGMGDNIYLGDRNGVRTPMQWTADRNGGFSRADPQRLYLPAIMDPVYGYRGGQRRGAGAQTRRRC
ncbi:MAG: hypothetical protein MZV49_21630 [Rhodopseudomonas palustris]|nr:hypothetical protein [Rhodopseudomonas palustris]